MIEEQIKKTKWVQCFACNCTEGIDLPGQRVYAVVFFDRKKELRHLVWVHQSCFSCVRGALQHFGIVPESVMVWRMERRPDPDEPEYGMPEEPEFWDEEEGKGE